MRTIRVTPPAPPLDEASSLRQGITMALDALGPAPFTSTEKEVQAILLRTLFGEEVPAGPPDVLMCGERVA